MLKLLNIVDEFTRECPGHRRRTAPSTPTAWWPRLERLAIERGAPAYVRFDNGPEFIAYAVADWCRFNGTDTVFIDPASLGRTPGSRASTGGCATST